jgi:hypothetical protein
MSNDPKVLTLSQLSTDYRTRPEMQFYADLLDPTGSGISNDLVEQIEQSVATHGKVVFNIEGAYIGEDTPVLVWQRYDE